MTAKRILAAAFSIGLLAAVAPLRGDDGSASKFQIRLYGGLSYLSGGDVNDGVGGFFHNFTDVAHLYGDPVNGGFNAAHLGMSFGGDFIFQITPHFGIGVGAGYIQASKESSIIETGNVPEALTAKAAFNALPIKLGAFFSYPLGPSVDIHINVGGGYYIAKMAAMLQSVDIAFGSYASDTEAIANGFGFQGGVGFDFRIVSNVFLFIETQGQIANFGGFKGTSTLSIAGGQSNSRTGKLYYWEEKLLTGTYPGISVVATIPPSDSKYYIVREAKVSFNGGQLVVGILFKI